MKVRAKRKHRGSIRTERRVRYVEAALAAALADADMRDHVALLGNLFPARRGQKVTPQQLSRALAARHPSTGKLLRKRVNAGLRWEGDSLVSNVCHGFDIPLSVDKSISIAALAFGDPAVLKMSMDAMRQSARWLSKRMDRRLRRDGQSGTAETATSAIFFIPEKAGRDGQPQLHAHLVFPNLTTFQEDGRTKYCAGHFRRITRMALEAQRRMNRQLARHLQKSGYAVEVVGGVCRLPGVSRELCEEMSPVSRRLNAGGNGEGMRRRSTKRTLRNREDRYLKNRPRKVLQPLAQWRANWTQMLGPDRLKSGMAAYQATRYRKPAAAKTPSTAVIPFTPEVNGSRSVIAAALVDGNVGDEVLEAKLPEGPRFKRLGVDLRARLQRELPSEAKTKVIEIVYECSDKRPDLVEHTEALRTLLRLIFPRVLIHQRFSAHAASKFSVVGTAAANPSLATLVSATAHALEVELGESQVRANWPAVLRWLHSELANRPPEPIIKASKVKRMVPVATAPAHATPKPPAVTPVESPAPVKLPRPAPSGVDIPMPGPEPEMEMLP